MLGELALDPAGQMIGRAVVEQHEFEAGMVGVPGDILHQGLLEVMKPSHADREDREPRHRRGGGVDRNQRGGCVGDAAITHGSASGVLVRSARQCTPPDEPLLLKEDVASTERP